MVFPLNRFASRAWLWAVSSILYTSAAFAQMNPPTLGRNVEKEISQALEDLRVDKPNGARKHLEKASHVAPSDPDVDYLWGMYYAQVQDFAKAKTHWERAIQIAPRHVFSLDGLAQLALQNSDYAAATEYLLRASEADPSSWRYHERLAESYLNQKQYAQALNHARRALELGKERAAEVQLVLAQIFIQSNDIQAALKALDQFLDSHPSKERAVAARGLADELQRGSPAAFDASLKWDERSSPFTAPTVELMPPPKWMPPDIDESMPPVDARAGCPLQTIQREAGKRVSGFVDAVNRIAATESLEHELMDRFGHAAQPTARSFSYVSSIEQLRPGLYTMDEYRNGSVDLDQFPDGIATLGLPALVMVFHPSYVGDYDLICEGLSRRRDGLAWQVHFQQKPDLPARLRSYRVNGTSYPIALRGRAWILTDTFQIEGLETNLVSPVPKIRLRAEHIAVRYAPVRFLSHHTELWLPESAEVYFDFRGRRMHRRHEFRDYMLFAVDERQQISLPTIEADVP
jgi:tetratricopeptide (TPR) repeat protein